MPYLATENVPGYLPQDDDPPVFGTPAEAWEYLAGERRRGEDDTPGDVYSDTVDELEAAAASLGEGTVYGATPGYDGDHDLGLAYSVTLVAGGPDGNE
jgi:hypothetical protein